jgi:hypothetical protein
MWGSWGLGLRDRICLATCCGRVKVAWQTEHLWSPAMVKEDDERKVVERV